MKATEGSLMELNVLHLQSKSIFLWSLFDWMHALGGNHLFVICLSLLILHIFYSLKGTWTIIILFPFSVSNKFCTYMYKTSLNFFFDGKTTLNLILLLWAGNIWLWSFCGLLLFVFFERGRVPINA